MFDPMQRIVVLLFYILSSSICLNAQIEDKHLWEESMDKALMESIKLKSKEPLMTYFQINFKNYQGDQAFEKNFLKHKIAFFQKVDKVNLQGLSGDQITQNQTFIDFLNDLSRFQTLCEDCKIGNLIFKRSIYRELGIAYLFPNDEWAYLKTLNYKEPLEGVSFGAKYSYIGDHFLGVDFGLFNKYDPGFKYTSDVSGEVFNSSSFYAQVINFSVQYGTRNHHFLFLFNPVAIIAPLTVKPLQLGLEKSKDRSALFYRPELGYGYKRFYISGGYNIVFKKANRDFVNRWALTLRWNYILSNGYN